MIGKEYKVFKCGAYKGENAVTVVLFREKIRTHLLATLAASEVWINQTASRGEHFSRPGPSSDVRSSSDSLACTSEWQVVFSGKAFKLISLGSKTFGIS